jgi:hypothetical protein
VPASRKERVLARLWAVVNDGLAFVVMKAEMAANWVEERAAEARKRREGDSRSEE